MERAHCTIRLDIGVVLVEGWVPPGDLPAGSAGPGPIRRSNANEVDQPVMARILEQAQWVPRVPTPGLVEVVSNTGRTGAGLSGNPRIP